MLAPWFELQAGRGYPPVSLLMPARHRVALLCAWIPRLCGLGVLFLVSSCGGENAVSPDQWIWQGGSNSVDGRAVYGIQGVAAPDNVPGSRGDGASWRDGAGNFWLFGGSGLDGNGNLQEALNDLWMYEPKSALWTWVNGPQTPSAGLYGILGVPSKGKLPGARHGAASWIDNAGNLWLFGGSGYDAQGGMYVELNDLWKFVPTAGTWIWMSGSSTGGAEGSYGTLGHPAPGNVPGARDSAVTWVDQAGNLWLFGGSGVVSGSLHFLNDLWQFNPTMGLWTWVSGSSGGDPLGTYGTKGLASPANAPGGRAHASSWIDSAGTLWLFGGSGFATSYLAPGELNDLWSYQPSTGLWSWVSGSDSIPATGATAGTYGTLGVPSITAVPGARRQAAAWLDAAEKFWLFGGSGADKNGSGGNLNDVWSFDPQSRLWTWVSGSSVINAPVSYGTKGIPASDNTPGGRFAPFVWTDASAAAWIFGGTRYVVTPYSYFNDVWKYGH
jgi:N-acetylneuraminic acid mutarotase